MKKKWLLKIIPFLIFAFFIVSGCQPAGKTAATDEPMMAAIPEVKAEKEVYKGKILGKSNKAKSISIKVGKGAAAKTIMVKFDDQTKGLEHAKKGEAAIIKFKTVGSDKIAVEVMPKLAKLPSGVAEVQPDYVAGLIDKGIEKGNYFLVDSRPASRFHEGTIPTSVSIPVPKITKEGASAVLPKNKNTEVIFYCGGPT
jgi:hypothetical protein